MVAGVDESSFIVGEVGGDTDHLVAGGVGEVFREDFFQELDDGNEWSEICFVAFDGVDADELLGGGEGDDSESGAVDKGTDGADGIGVGVGGVFLEGAGAEGFVAEIGFFLKLGLESIPEVRTEPGGQFRVDDVAQKGCGVFGLVGAGLPAGMMQEELAAGFFVDALDEVFDELVDVPLAVSAVAETIILEGKSELVDEFLEELGTMLKVRGERRFVFYPKIIESSERHISLVVGVSAGAETALTQDVAEAEAAEAVGVAFVEPVDDEGVEVGAVLAEKGAVGVEVGLADFDGAIVIKGHVHAKTSL